MQKNNKIKMRVGESLLFFYKMYNSNTFYKIELCFSLLVLEYL